MSLDNIDSLSRRRSARDDSDAGVPATCLPGMMSLGVETYTSSTTPGPPCFGWQRSPTGKTSSSGIQSYLPGSTQPFLRGGEALSRIRDLVREAAQAIQDSFPDGFAAADICRYLDERHPHPSGRAWRGNMAIPGDYAVWSDTGEAANPSAAGDEGCPKFLVRVTTRNHRPKLYRLRDENAQPTYLAPYLTEGRIYTREDLRQEFTITDATLNTGIFRPIGSKSVWLFVTDEKTSDRTQYSDSLEGDILRWQGQTAGRKDRLIIEHETTGHELMVFHRKSRYEHPGAGFRYEGCFRYVSHEGVAPANFVLQRIRDNPSGADRGAAGTRYWAFFANPEVYDVERAIESLLEDTWTVGTKEIRQGDWAVIWKGKGRSPHRGVVALAQVLSDPSPMKEPENTGPFWLGGAPGSIENRVRIRYHVPPLAPTWLERNADGPLADLSVSRATGGTVFIVTPAQWSAVLDALGAAGLDFGGQFDSSEVGSFDDFDPHNIEDSRTRAVASAVRRRGQDVFRAALMAAYSGRCCVTGCDVGAAVEAAHILGYRGAATNHPQNGILLRADLHKLFDRKLLSIDPTTWTVKVADSIRNSDYGEFHGASIQMPSSSAQRPSREAMRKHFDSAGVNVC